MSTPMPEVALLSVLRSSLDTLETDQSAVDDLFSILPDTVRTTIKTWLSQHKVEVRYNWPRPDAVMPSIHVVTSGENESVGEDALGDVLDVRVDRASGEVREVTGYASSFSISLLVISTSEELTLYLSQLVRRIVFLAKMALEQAGLHNVRISSSDMRFEQDYFPDFAYARSVNVEGMYTFEVVPTTATETLIKTIVVNNTEQPVFEKIYIGQTMRSGRVSHGATLKGN